MTPVDWEYHKKRYAEEFAPANVTKADYARLHDLPLNTARRVFSSVKVEKNPPATPQKKKKPKVDVNAGVKEVIAKKARAISAANRKKKVEQASDRLLLGDHPAESDHIAGKSTRSPTEVITPSGNAKINKRDKSTRCKAAVEGAEGAAKSQIQGDHFLAERGGDHLDRHASMSFGAFADFLGLDPEVQAAAELIGTLHGIGQLQVGRYLQMTKVQLQMKRDIEADYAKGDPWKDGMGNVIPKSRAMAECLFSPSEQMTQIETSISRNILMGKKLELDYREAHPLTHAERVARKREILSDRIKHGWSALETAQKLEIEGITAPASLHVEAVKEISFMTPPIEEDAGISEEELEAKSQAYLQKQQETLRQWLPNRREEISALFAEEMAHQRGELLTEGEFTELEPDDNAEAEEGLVDFQGNDDMPVDEVW